MLEHLHSFQMSWTQIWVKVKVKFLIHLNNWRKTKKKKIYERKIQLKVQPKPWVIIKGVPSSFSMGF